MPSWIDKWSGGRVYVDRNKRRIYVIEKKLDGKRYAVRLPSNIKDPEAELALFLRDPEGYRERNAQTGLAVDDEAVVLSKDEVEAFARYQRAEHLAADYITGCKAYLTDWSNALKGRDLRKLRHTDLEKLLDATDAKGAPVWPMARNYRINALRSYLTWKRLPINIARLLQVHKPLPSRMLKRVAYTRDEVSRFYSLCSSQRIRDYYLIAAKTGMHGTEIGRIARDDVELEVVGREGIAATMKFIHKTGDHTVSIDAQTLAAVRRLMAQGKVPSTTIVAKWANKIARVTGTVVHHGKLRHSFFSWMRRGGKTVVIEGGGVPMSEIAALVNHRSMLMGKDHYDDGIPPMGVPGINLYHPEDPVALEQPERMTASA